MEFDGVALSVAHGRVVVLDPGDLSSVLLAGPWFFHEGTGYTRAKGVYLHRFLMGCIPGDGLYVDHINRDRLDHRRRNLRVATSRESAQNRGVRAEATAGFRGVTFMPGRKRPYQATVQVDGKRHFLGYFATASDAGAAAAAGRAYLMTHAQEALHV